MFKVTLLRCVRGLAGVSGAVLAGVPAAGPAFGGDGSGDRLVVSVRHSGDDRLDGTRELYCHPGGGDHPDPVGACAVLERNTVWGVDPFAPVAADSVCTPQHGGPVAAHVTGWWAGRPVDAVFGRGNGCEIERWDRFVPLLPGLRPADRPRPSVRPPAL